MCAHTHTNSYAMHFRIYTYINTCARAHNTYIVKAQKTSYFHNIK